MNKKTVSIVTSMLMIFATFISVAGTSSANDWPMFKLNKENTAFSTETDLNIADLLWSKDTSSKIQSSPAIVNEKLYVGSTDGRLHCLKATTGEKLWDLKIGDGITSSPAIADGKIYIPSEDGVLWCLDAETGEEVWNKTAGSTITYASPTIYNGKIYQLANGYLFCLNATDGAYEWSTEVGSGSGTPAIYNDNVYIGAQKGLSNKIYRLDAETGDSLASIKLGNALTSPAVADGKVYIASGSGDNHLFCLNATNLETIWDKPFGGNVQGSPAVAYGKVYIGSWEKKLHCLNAETGDVEWEYQTEGAITLSSPAIADNKVFFGSYDKKFYVVNAEDGQLTYSYETMGYVQCSPSVSDGIVFIGSDDRKLYAFGYSDEPKIEIGYITGGLLKIDAEIKNTGDADATNINWSIDLEGGIIFIGGEASGNIDSLEKGSTVTATDAPVVGLGGPILGPVSITVEAIAEGSELVSKTVEGFVFFIFVVIQ